MASAMSADQLIGIPRAYARPQRPFGASMTTTGPDGENYFVDRQGGPTRYQDLIVGCSLAIGGNLLISISLNIQKYSHIKNEKRDVSRHYTRDPFWWLGLLLMGLGEIGNFSAYGYAPASLVAPLGTTTVVANMFLAAAFLKEKIRPEHLFGSVLAIVGACLLVTFSSKKEHILDGEEIMYAISEISFIVYVCIELAALCILLFLLYKMKIRHVIIYLLITSISASFTVIAAKAVSSMLHLSIAGYSQFRYAIFYVMFIIMVVTVVVQVKFLNLAMKNFNSTVVVPTNFVFFTISAITAGIIFFKEFWGMSVLGICMFFFGCFLSFIGVYFVTGEKLSDSTTMTTKTPDEERTVAEVFPSWLVATLHRAPVQPRGTVTHLMDKDREVAANISASDSSASHSSLFEPESPMKSYGSTT